MKEKIVTLEQALETIHDGQTIMFGDWHGQLAANEIIDGILEKGVKDIHAIAVSAGMVDTGIGKLIHNDQFASLITTHIGLNPEAKDKMYEGKLDIEFSPMGTWIERIRCGGAGLGGCLTPTGLGTTVEEGKSRLMIEGKPYLLETALHADVAVIKAWKADKAGNIVFRLNARATNSNMAFAADHVIVEVEEIVEIGELGPQEIDVPAPLVGMVYLHQGELGFCPMWKKLKAKAEAKAAEAKAAKEAAEKAAKEAEEAAKAAEEAEKAAKEAE